MHIFLRLYSMADLKGDNGLPALILSQILLNCQQNLSSVQHLIFRLLDQAPGWVPGWAHEEYADRRFTRFLVRRLHTRLMTGETFPIRTWKSLPSILNWDLRTENFQGTIFLLLVFLQHVQFVSLYSETPLIRALRGASKVSVLTGCPYYAGWLWKCKGFLSPRTKQTVHNNKASVLSGVWL